MVDLPLLSRPTTRTLDFLAPFPRFPMLSKERCMCVCGVWERVCGLCCREAVRSDEEREVERIV